MTYKLLKTVFIITYTALLVGCGDDKETKVIERDQIAMTPQHCYHTTTQCGWSYELQCYACAVNFPDGKLGGKCQ